jgi:hypothetical protein
MNKENIEQNANKSMIITNEQIKRLANSVKIMQAETSIDDDVSGGYHPEPFKSAYAEIYVVIDECERGLNVNEEEIKLPPSTQSSETSFICGECSDYKESDRGLWYCSKCGSKLK